MGNDSSRAISVAAPSTAFVRVTNVRCLRLPEAAAQLVAAPPLVNQGPHGNGAADTDVVEVRRVLLMPPVDAPRLLTEAPLGTMTKAAFHQQFIQAGLAHADADVVNAWTQIGLWFRAACTMVNTGGADVNCLSVTTATPANPADMFAVGAWHSSRREQLERCAGVGGPGLTTNAFNAGITNLQATVNTVATQRLDFERARAERSFTEKHVDALAQRMHCSCDAGDDNHLPKALRLLAKSTSKSRDYAIFGNLFGERAQALPVPLTASQAPLATTKPVHDVFRNFTPAGTGLVFASHLTPFAVVCEGHAKAFANLQLMKKAKILEAVTTRRREHHVR